MPFPSPTNRKLFLKGGKFFVGSGFRVPGTKLEELTKESAKGHREPAHISVLACITLQRGAADHTVREVFFG